MNVLVVTITRDPWPAQLTRHWHIADTFLSRHLVGSVHAVYGKNATINEYALKEPICPECDQRLA